MHVAPLLIAAAAAPAQTNQRHLTPLRFRRHAPQQPPLHDTTQHNHTNRSDAIASLLRHRRRLQADSNSDAVASLHGTQLRGNLFTLGYFSAYVCVGTPPVRFDLIVDTGSALTALPCGSCTHCGAHKHGDAPGARFSEAVSSTDVAVTCTRPPKGMQTCRTCDGGRCGYSVSYTEGSSIRGHFVEDRIWVAGADSRRHHINASFGCQTYESGLFYSQEADGITGLSQSLSYGNTLFDSIRADLKTPNIFSMCLGQEMGALVLGGSVPEELEANWIPYSGSASYVVELTDIRFDGVGIGESSSTYRTTIIDSGTTFMYLPTGAYHKVLAKWQSSCPWGACSARVVKGPYPDDYCYTATADEIERFGRSSLHFANGVAVDFGPASYAYELAAGKWCLGVFDNNHAGAVIGGANMRNHEVIFDREKRRVAFVPSNCEQMHRYERASVLVGGYGLGGCEEGVAV